MPESHVISANGLRVHVLAAGPPEGPLVVCLHGFPELARSWLRQRETELRGPARPSSSSRPSWRATRVSGGGRGTSSSTSSPCCPNAGWHATAARSWPARSWGAPMCAPPGPPTSSRSRAAFARPGRAKAAIDWYRAAFRGRLLRRGRIPGRPIAAPTLVLWGARDRFLGVELADPARLQPFFAPGCEPEVVLVEEAGHFVQNEAPDRVDAELLRWLGTAA